MNGHIQIVEWILIIGRQPSQLAVRHENAYTTMNSSVCIRGHERSAREPVHTHYGYCHTRGQAGPVLWSVDYVAICRTRMLRDRMLPLRNHLNVIDIATCNGFRIVPTGPMENTLLVGDLFLSGQDIHETPIGSEPG